MLKPEIRVLCCAAILLTCGFTLGSQEPGQAAKSGEPIVATVHRSQGKLEITVEPNLAPNGDILRAFGILIQQRGRD